MAEITEFVQVSKLPDHSRETNPETPISKEDLFLVSENDASDTKYNSKRLTYDTLTKSLFNSLGVGQWLPKDWVMDNRWIYGNNIICSDVEWPQGPEYDKNNPMFLWALKQTLSANVVSAMSHPVVSAMSDVFAGHEFDQISSKYGYFERIDANAISAVSGVYDILSATTLYVNGEDVKAFQFKGHGLYVSDTEISDITPTNPTYGQIVTAAGHQGWVYQVANAGVLSNLEYASNGSSWIQLGFELAYASKSTYGIVKIGTGGIDVEDGVISTEDHFVCSKKYFDDLISTGTVDQNTFYYLSDDNGTDVSASPSTVGGVKLGYQDNANNFALRIDGETRAYVQVPYAKELSAGLAYPTQGLTYVGTAGGVGLSASGVAAGGYGLSADTQVQTNAAFQVPYLSVDSYGRVVSATSHSATLVPDVIWWQSVVTCSSWRRLCKVTPDSQYPNFIVSVSAQRDGVTYNNTFAVSVYGKGLANVTKISGSAAQSVSVRVTSAADGTCYFEIFDGNSASTVSQTVRCGIVKTSKSTVQTYSTAEDGTTPPDGYSACDALVCSTASIDAKSISADVIYGDAVATTTPASDPSPATDLNTDQWNQAYEATSLSSGSWNQAYEKTKELNQLSSVAIAFYVEGKVDPVTYNFVVSQ